MNATEEKPQQINSLQLNASTVHDQSGVNMARTDSKIDAPLAQSRSGPVRLEVAIIEHETERTVKAVPAASLREAGKIERGMNINLDERFYYTEVRVVGS